MIARRRAPIRPVVGLAVSALCVYLALRGVEWRGLGEALTRVRPAWLAASALTSVMAFGAAALRWRRLVDRQVRLTPLEAFESLMIGNATNLVVPTRLGDVMRAVLVAKKGEARVTALLASVVVERAADMLMLLVCALLMSLVIVVPGPIAVALRTLALVLVATIVVFIAAADRLAAASIAAISSVAPALAERIGPQIDAFILELRAAGGRGRWAGVLALSAVAWALWGLAASCGVRAFDLAVPWYGGFFVMTVVNLGGLVPASPGGIGVYHYLAMVALSVWVADPALALGYAIVSHALSVGIILLLGLVSWLTS